MSRWLLAAPVLVLVLAGGLLVSSPGSGQRVPPPRSGIVRIETRSCGVKLVGTGFLLDSHHVATAEHVVAGATRIVFKRAGRVVGSGTIAGADRSRDVALIRSDRALGGHVFSLSGRAARTGERVAALGFRASSGGHARGFARLLARGGRVSQRLIQTDASTRPGYSGGPLVSARDGSVLGLVDLSSAARGGPSFAVEARAAAPLLGRWLRDPEAVPQRRCGL